MFIPSSIKTHLLLLTIVISAVACSGPNAQLMSQLDSSSALELEQNEATQNGSNEEIEDDYLANSVLQLGAKGDGITDDSRVLESIFKSNPGICYDGENKEYLVNQIVKIENDLCLQNFQFVRQVENLDLSAYMKSARLVLDSNQVDVSSINTNDHNFLEDEIELDTDTKAKMMNYINQRMLLVRGRSAEKINVQLTNVSFNKGSNYEAGSRTDSAALWIDNAKSIQLKNVQVSGAGKGHGIFIIASENIRLENIYIHDLIWQLYDEEVPLSFSSLERYQQNNLPIFNYSPTHNKFAYQRSQEQINGLFIVSSKNVELLGIRVERVGAMVEGEFYPWQADGISLVDIEGLRIAHAIIDNTWEGIDLGGASKDFLLEDLEISNSHAFAVKIPHTADGGVVRNSVIRNSGYSGVVLAGVVKNIVLDNILVEDTGLFVSEDRVHLPWVKLGTIAGYRIMGADEAENRPANIEFTHCIAENLVGNDLMKFGFLNDDPNWQENANVFSVDSYAKNYTEKAVYKMIEE